VTPHELAGKINEWARRTTIGPHGMWETNPTAEFQPGQFPLTPQLSVNLIRNTNRGTLVAEAEIVHRGRTTLVVDMPVSDERRRLIARLTATLLTPATPVATASADPTGR
jgi:hypothetical protein